MCYYGFPSTFQCSCNICIMWNSEHFAKKGDAQHCWMDFGAKYFTGAGHLSRLDKEAVHSIHFSVWIPHTRLVPLMHTTVYLHLHRWPSS